MKTILYNPIFINPQAYYVFPRLTRWLRPDDSYKEPANYIGQIEVTIIAYGEIGYTEYFEHTNYIDFTNFSNSYVRISLFTRLGACVLGEWKIGTMEGDRPYIEPEVLASLKAVVIVGDKTNQDKDRDIVANLVDASNPFIISNAAYKLNSGYGKYEEDFTSWIQTNGVIVSSDRVQNSILGRFLYFNTVDKKEDVPTFKVNIKLGEQSKLQYNYIKEDGTSTYVRYSESGIYTIPTSYFSKYTGGNAWFGFYQIEGTSTIEQIPSYQGAFVTDGVDDLITSTKTVQEMLEGSNKITVVSMIHLVQTPAANSEKAYTNQIRTGQNYLRNYVTDNGKTGIYGYTCKGNNVSVINNILGDKNDYTVENKSWNNLAKFSVIGYEDNGTINELDQVAWYWTIIANKVLTTDQINQVIAYYNLDRCVEPTVLYDVKRQGLSNDTPDSDWYLKDYSGNGYDMTLYNYAKTPESGINEDGGLQSDGVNDFGKVTGMPIYKDYTVVADYVRTFAKENMQDAPILSKSQVAGDGAFLFNYLNVNSVISSYSFGTNNVLTNVSDSERKIYYQSKYVNGGKSINSGTGTDYDSMWLGTYRDDSQFFFTGAIYSLMTFPYSMSEFLIERQLKKHKLGTLYPDMVEWRPIYTSNVNDYTTTKATYFGEVGQRDLDLGNHYPIGTRFRIYVKPSGAVDEVTSIKVNGVELTYDYIDSNYGYAFNGTLSSKSPQKIDITIDEYIRYEDIVQPYPAIVTLKQDGKDITWGDKLKVGDEVTFVTHTNLLPNLYTVSGAMYYNGKFMYGNTPITVAKSMTFTTVHNYIKSNEPKCILSPSRLRIPNSSYKILGYIPDISGHGNHGKINNSAYAEGSGVNADGSYQLDGVDDFITIPTTVGGKQVLMKVNWQSSIGQGMLYDQRGTAFAIWNSDKHNDDETDTIPAYSARNGGNTYIDGILNKNILASQLRNITHNIVATNTMLNGSSVSPTIGCRAEYDAYFTNMSLYDFLLFDEISTDEEILTLNEYVGIEGNTDDLFN